jgi:hypothetical protein
MKMDATKRLLESAQSPQSSASLSQRTHLVQVFALANAWRTLGPTMISVFKLT